ncbi:MAG: DUF6686 family protein [Bacteroidota bacterium]
MELLAATASGEIRFCTDCDTYRILWMGVMIDFEQDELAHFKRQLERHHHLSNCCMDTEVVVPTGLKKLWLRFSKDELLRFSELLDEAQDRHAQLMAEPWHRNIELYETPAISRGAHAIGSKQLIADYELTHLPDHLRMTYGNWGIDLPYSHFWELYENVETIAKESMAADEGADHYLVLDTPLQNLKLLINVCDAPAVLNELQRAAWRSPALQSLSGRWN